MQNSKMDRSNVAVGSGGVLIDGQPFYLLSGCIHYFRWPRAEWRPLLEQARAFGLNTIDTVIPWNRHEPNPGVFDFAAEADLGAFLDLCHELGLKAIVRPGPYICAEWENGGLPAWLTADPDIRLRTDDERYLNPLLRWFDTLMAILAPRQHGNGGPIILCQIENEHWASTVYAHDGHQATLARAAEERGIAVPQYTCMGAMPGRPELRNGWSGIAEKLEQTRRLWAENPLIVSELWSGWFDNWGDSRQARKTAAKLDMILHQLTAVGCSGFSHWMWAGGTNFGYWGGRTVGGDSIHMATSYDYDAPISEFGIAREKAYVARRHHLFLATLGADLAAVLAEAGSGGLTVIGPPVVRGRSEGGSAPYRNLSAGPDAPEAWQQFRCTFLENPTQEAQIHQVFLDEPACHLSVEVEPATIKPIFCHMPLSSRVKLVAHTGRILGFWRAPELDRLIIYGREGEQGRLQLAFGADYAMSVERVSPGVHVEIEGQQVLLRYWIGDEPGRISLHMGERSFQVILLSQARAERYGLKGEDTSPPSRPLRLPVEALAVHEHSANEGWQALTRPLPLERLECDYGYGWYRAELELATPLDDTLAAPHLSDRVTVLAGGERIGTFGIDPDGPHFALPLRLAAGSHDLRLLADNLGRFNYGAALGEHKGLLDTLYLGGRQEDISDGWTALWQEAAFAGEALAHAHPHALRADREAVHLGHFAFEGPTVWLLRELAITPQRRYILHLTGDRNSGALFVNGTALERFSRHRSGGLIHADITNLLRPDGPNVLSLNIQNYAAAPWRATLLSYDPARPLTARWGFCAGVSPDEQREPPEHGPAFYRSRFTRSSLPKELAAIRLRVAGLAKGQIWLNGRNVGRFWQIGPQEDYKLPVSWLGDENELLIFAEAGRAEHVTVLVS